MRYEYYCKYCDLPQEVVKPIKDVKATEWCKLCQLPLERRFSIPQVNMKRMAGNVNGEDFAVTNEPPDDLKPDTYHEKLQGDLDNWKIISTPTHTRRAGTVEKP